MSPQVISRQSRFIVVEGSTLSLDFTINSANPPVQSHDVIWLLNNETLLNNRSLYEGTSLRFSSNYLSLIISNITYGIAGRISLYAHNPAGYSSDHIDVLVHGKLTMFNSYYHTVLLQCSSTVYLYNGGYPYKIIHKPFKGLL